MIDRSAVVSGWSREAIDTQRNWTVRRKKILVFGFRPSLEKKPESLKFLLDLQKFWCLK